MTDLLIVGDGKQAEVICDYLAGEPSGLAVRAFAVEAQYRKQEQLRGLPVMDLERLDDWRGKFYVAVTFAQLNALRARLFEACLAKGWRPASFTHSSSVVAVSAEIGEHVFIGPLNNIDPCVIVEDNVYLHTQNHIGHHSTIRGNVFISSGVTISGMCNIGRNTFIGVGANIGHGVTIGDGCIIGAGTLVTKDTPAGSLVRRSNDRPDEARRAKDISL